MTPPEEHPTTGFIRILGNVDALFLAFGAMIGFGWVVLTGGWISDAGSLGAVLAFVAGGVIMCFVGLVYAELVAAMPKAGGEHHYLLRALGPRLSVVGSWAIIGGYITVVLFEAVAVPNTALYLFPDLNRIRLWTVAGFDVHLTWALVGVVAAVVLTWINIRGIRMASLVQTYVVVFLLLVAALMVVGALVGGEGAFAAPLVTGGPSGFLAVLVVVPFLFVGFDVIPQSSEEVDVPPRRIGVLVVTSVVMATLFYVVVVVTTSVSMPVGDLAGTQLATGDALSAMLGHPIWGKIVIAGGLAGILTSWNAFLIGASRLMWAMARSGMLPAWFGRLHPRNRTPVNALLVIGGLSAVAPFFGSPLLDWAVDSGSPSIVITYFLVAVAFLVLRRREPGMPRPMRVGGAGRLRGTVIGVAAAVLTLGLLALYLPGMPAFLDWQPWVIFGAWWLVGLVLVLRTPRGVGTGEGAEERLLARLAARDGPR
ncbi:APC family permease [Actinomycetospora sp. NBC_00405]|uniref:APC family permease n=1 Tax=Actinomycetospora sp. NBC_00405 TaxID=2975952 RepID=UPI002E204CD7